MAFRLQQVPGYIEALRDAKSNDERSREDNWLAMTTTVAGCPLRVMTLRDYVALLRSGSVIMQKIEPDHHALAQFLWALSPEIERWNEGEGWRQPWAQRWFYNREKQRHQGRLFRHLKIKELEKTLAGRTEPYILPEDHPITSAIVEVFKYVERVFMESPAQCSKGKESGLCYLNSWFDLLQSQYHTPTEEMWKTPMPVLFAKLKAITQRLNPTCPDFSDRQDRLNSKIISAMQGGMSEEDILAGKLKLGNN